MLLKTGGITRTRDDLFHLGYGLVDHIDPEILNDPSGSLRVNVFGTHRAGKSILRDAVFSRILGVVPEELEFEERHFSGKSHGLDAKGYYFVTKSSKDQPELIFCDLQAASDETFVELLNSGANTADIYWYMFGKVALLDKSRTRSGVTILQNGYGPSHDLSDICIGVESVELASSTQYQPFCSGALTQDELSKRGLVDKFQDACLLNQNQGVDNEWLRAIHLEVNFIKLITSPRFQRYMGRINQSPVLDASVLAV